MNKQGVDIKDRLADLDYLIAQLTEFKSSLSYPNDVVEDKLAAAINALTYIGWYVNKPTFQPRKEYKPYRH